jgi:hypothetical protein
MKRLKVIEAMAQDLEDKFVKYIVKFDIKTLLKEECQVMDTIFYVKELSKGSKHGKKTNKC